MSLRSLVDMAIGIPVKTAYSIVIPVGLTASEDENVDSPDIDYYFHASPVTISLKTLKDGHDAIDRSMEGIKQSLLEVYNLRSTLEITDRLTAFIKGLDLDELTKDWFDDPVSKTRH